MELRFVADDRLVSTATNLQFGRPGVDRSIITLAADGSVKTVVSDRLSDADKAQRTFEATFTRK